MRQLRCVLKSEFPYTKVFVLGLILTLLGCGCVVVSVIGIIKLAWGYYVSTGMWGGLMVTVSGLAAMYSARAQTSLSARIYFCLSILACLVSFAMLVLSAGGLTYKSNFYLPERFNSRERQVTLFLHGSVLGVSVLSLACNVLSVIVCCKFMTREKDRGQESIKLRRYRQRSSNSSSAHRSGSSRRGSGTVRSSNGSRTPFFGSDRSRKHTRQSSDSDCSTSLKIRSERASHRRDSERSNRSSRSRHSHNRQSSSVSQYSRTSAPMETEATTVLLRDTDSGPGSHLLAGQREWVPPRSTAGNARGSQAGALTDSASVQLVFDPDEEPLPPYEEAVSTMQATISVSEAAEIETVDNSSNVVIPSYLPLNIPVTHIGVCERQTLQRQPPPSVSSPRPRHAQPNRAEGQTVEGGGSRGGVDASDRGNSTTHISSDIISSTQRDNCINLMRMSLSGDRPKGAASQAPAPMPSQGDSGAPAVPEDRSASPEICALTGERLTPVAAVQLETVKPTVFSSFVPPMNRSSDSSDTSIPAPVPQTSVSSRARGVGGGGGNAMQQTSSNSPCALPAGIRSPASAFRPVGRRMVPMSQSSPSASHTQVPLHNFFSPISSPGSAHHTIYSPVASPSAAPQQRATSPTSPRHGNNMASSSESLSRGGVGQSLAWKKIPLPVSHNQSNKTASVPAKEVTSKNIPGPAVPTTGGSKLQSQSLPREAFREVERVAPLSSSKSKKSNSSKGRSGLVPADTNSSQGPGPQFATFPVRRPQETSALAREQKRAPRHSVDNQPTAIGARSAFDRCHTNAGGSHPAAVTNSCNSNASASHPAPTKPSHSSAAARDQQVSQMETNRRSAGCQATEEDGGLSSSMDRTHRWVMGTLPSTGSRFQGTTRNMAHLHSTSTSGTRSSLVAVGNRHGAKAHGVWNRPSKTTAAGPIAFHDSPSAPNASSSQPIVVQPTRPVVVAGSMSPAQKGSGSASSRLPRYQHDQPSPHSHCPSRWPSGQASRRGRLRRSWFRLKPNLNHSRHS